ncbi:1-acyl-sn-glycerol-3-phosphate acyltransferase [Marinihelvus fidelis]|uniref:1-acyl-sn-glycerol-3-phosphate acyltransferase n=1 Tax=Marinihelvus fidelis TaxID=2613842 RepID=A0A5N0TA42_9GAMM|nr:lysophospholipid acyltransferase family protein [Marinihelvus fidelis]KAA9131923.1 1-acyl-sn-glycerol-3-phosphate acyltransferase [Marinihelvus fidelis]
MTHGQDTAAKGAPGGAPFLLVFIYRVYAWLIFFPVVAIWSFLCGWMAVLAAVVISPSFGSRVVGGTWARVIGWLTPIRVRVEGREHIDPDQTYVVVCNHVSQYDIISVYGWLPLDLRWVMKQELRKLPGIGIACEKVGHIIVDRSNPEAAKRSITDALERIGDGVGILFFPEGTRSLDGRLRPFKSGAFRLAEEQGLPILPVSIVGTREVLPAKTFKLLPGKVRLVVHPPIAPGDRSATELKSLSRDAVASGLEALPRQG